MNFLGCAADSRPDREDKTKEGTVERDGRREEDKNSRALPRTVLRSPPLSSSLLPPPSLLSSSGEGSLGEIQTLQECYHCIALAAFPSSFNRLQTPLLHGALVFVSILIRRHCSYKFLSTCWSFLFSISAYFCAELTVKEVKVKILPCGSKESL